MSTINGKTIIFFLVCFNKICLYCSEITMNESIYRSSISKEFINSGSIISTAIFIFLLYSFISFYIGNNFKSKIKTSVIPKDGIRFLIVFKILLLLNNDFA